MDGKVDQRTLAVVIRISTEVASADNAADILDDGPTFRESHLVGTF